MPPPAPAAFMAWARAPILAIAAAARTDGRLYPASEAVPSGSGYRLTRARRSASSRRRSAPLGSAVITARRRAARSCPVVWSPAPGRTLASTARALSSSRTAVASAISRARPRSIFPARSAAPVAGSRQVRVTARSLHQDAAACDMVRASDTWAQASSGSRTGRPSLPVPIFLSAAADRAASSATTASSPAWAQDASRRYDAAIPARAPSSSSATGLVASQPARSGPVGSDSATRPETAASGRTWERPSSTASSSSANSASTGSTSGAAESETAGAAGSPGADGETGGTGAGRTGRFHGAGSLSAVSSASKSVSHDHAAGGSAGSAAIASGGGADVLSLASGMTPPPRLTGSRARWVSGWLPRLAISVSGLRPS